MADVCIDDRSRHYAMGTIPLTLSPAGNSAGLFVCPAVTDLLFLKSKYNEGMFSLSR